MNLPYKMGFIFLFFLVVKLCLAQNEYDYSEQLEYYYRVQVGHFPVREITNLEIIYGSHGVPVNFSYKNETGSDLISVPGCPKSIEGFPWVYYGNPPRCFLAFHTGPCPLEQRLILQAGSDFGTCACDCLYNLRFFQTSQRSKARYISCYGPGKPSQDDKQEKVFDKLTGKCYKTFEEDVNGPCPNGTGIVKYTPSSLTCQPICGFFYRKEPCVDPPPSGSYFPGEIDVRPCDPFHRYSEILKKCVLISKARVG